MTTWAAASLRKPDDINTTPKMAIFIWGMRLTSVFMVKLRFEGGICGEFNGSKENLLWAEQIARPLFQHLLHLLQLPLQSAADDLDQPQGPGLNHPLALRDGVAALRSVAHLGDVSRYTICLVRAGR
jgi:hypothetical protein